MGREKKNLTTYACVAWRLSYWRRASRGQCHIRLAKSQGVILCPLPDAFGDTLILVVMMAETAGGYMPRRFATIGD